MTTWKLEIYQNMPFGEDKNFVVDSLDDYLNAGTTFIIDNFAPFTPALDMSIRVQAPQLMALQLAQRGYVRARAYASSYSVTNYYYFFVRQVARVANETLELTLRMDTLNTYKGLVSALTDKTMINREHKDRFQYHDYGGAWPRKLTLANKIDFVSEGLQTRKHIASKETINDSENNQNFYLLYKTNKELTTDNLNNPVTCYLCADSPLQVMKSGSAAIVTWTPSQLQEDRYYYMMDDLNPSGKLTSSAGTTYTLDVYNSTDQTYIRGFILKKNGTGIDLWIVKAPTLTAAYPFTIYQWVSGMSAATFTACRSLRLLSILTDQFGTINEGTLLAMNSGINEAVLSYSINEGVDRTDSRYLKILKLPYSPMKVNTDADGNKTIIDFHFDLNEHLFVLDSISTSFTNNIKDESMKDIFITELTTYETSADFMLALGRGTLKETKLFHSDFFTYKLAYDNFNLSIAAEMCETADFQAQAGNYPYYTISFYATNTINSNFAFKVTPIFFAWKMEGDFANFIISTRNNEMTIFSNSYIDYIRTGFNYDKKAKSISAASTWGGAALSIVGGVGGAIVSRATGNEIGAAAAIGVAVSGFAQVASAIASTQQNENAMDAKLEELKRQATNAAGCDDIDLLERYGKNRLIATEWESSDEMKRLLNSLFYFYGYACGYQDTPNVTSRAWFNYLQCTPVFDSGVSLMKYNEVEDIKTRYQSGVTFIHMHTIDGTKEWGFDQDRENWENWLIA